MGSKRVAVIDYGMGNLHSVASALEHVATDVEVLVSADKAVIESADHIVFPGVGAIRDCMAEIRRLGFDQLVPELVASGRPVLGICVGMQALMRHSDENSGVEGLGLVDGDVHFFGSAISTEAAAGQDRLKVPHMGWNTVSQRQAHPLWQGIDDDSRFYFVHSYFVTADHRQEVVGAGHYGVDFDVAVAKGNLFAVQFHPEKSHTAGLQLLKNFLAWDGVV